MQQKLFALRYWQQSENSVIAREMSQYCSACAASGNGNQPFTLNLNAATANVTGGSTEAAPAINSEVGRIVNPGVTYNAGGRHL